MTHWYLPLICKGESLDIIQDKIWSIVNGSTQTENGKQEPKTCLAILPFHILENSPFICYTWRPIKPVSKASHYLSLSDKFDEMQDKEDRLSTRPDWRNLSNPEYMPQTYQSLIFLQVWATPLGICVAPVIKGTRYYRNDGEFLQISKKIQNRLFSLTFHSPLCSI